jgi:ATP-binding cassette, subfamily B, bacterial
VPEDDCQILWQELQPAVFKESVIYYQKRCFDDGHSDAAESIGFRTRGYRLTWEQLRDEVPLPCIVHWRQRHFVVVYGIKAPGKFTFPFGRGPGLSKKGSDDKKDEKTIVYVADPAQGQLKYTKKEFLKCWISTKKSGEQEGTALLFEPTPDFYRQEDEQKGKLKFMYLLGYLRPYRKFIAQLFLGMLTASIISLFFPFITQAIVDYGISNNDLAFILVMLIAQITLVFGQTANEFIRSWLMLHVTTFRHLFH